MENTLIKMAILWADVLLLAFVTGCIRRRHSVKCFREKKLFLERFIYYMAKGKSFGEILQEISMSLPVRTGLTRYIKRALALLKGPMDSYSQGKKTLEFIGRRLSAYPIRLVGQLALCQEEIESEDKSHIRVEKELTGLLHEIKNLWIKETDSLYHHLQFQRRLGLLAMLVLFLSNLIIYYTWQQKVSLVVFILINSLGVATIALLDIGTVVREPKLEGDKSAMLQWLLLILLLSYHRRVNEAIALSYDYGPMEIKGGLKAMTGAIRDNPDSLQAYHSLCGKNSPAQVYQCMDILYECRNLKGSVVAERLSAAIRNYINALDLSLEEAGKSRANTRLGLIRRTYQWAGSLGLMINIIFVLLHLSLAA